MIREKIMSDNTINQILEIINKREDLSPKEKSSLNMIVKELKHDLEDSEVIEKECIKMETIMPGLHSEYKKNKEKKIITFQEKMMTSIQHFNADNEEFVDTLNKLCTTLSNLGI